MYIGGELPPVLASALALHARGIDVPTGVVAHAEIGDHENAAAVFVAGDYRVSDDPRLLCAYSSMERSDRALLHDRRADALQASGEQSWSLGALPFHREHGSDPVAAADALRVAVDYCIDMGFYDATVDLAAAAGRSSTGSTNQITGGRSPPR